MGFVSDIGSALSLLTNWKFAAENDGAGAAAARF
jgi:hypothetical protein